MTRARRRGRTTTRAKKASAHKVRKVTTTSTAPRFTTINLRIHEIKCAKTTKEVDRDEISLAAIKVEGRLRAAGKKKRMAARAEKGKVLDAGKFKKGNRRRYKRPRIVARFNVGGKTAGWPRYYHANLLMIERDKGAIGAVVNAAVKSTEKALVATVTVAAYTAATTALAGVATGAAVGSAVPLVGTAIGAAAGAAVGLATKAIKKAREHDVFDPRHVYIRLPAFPSKAGEITGSRQTKAFKDFKGVYKVTYSWAIR